MAMHDEYHPADHLREVTKDTLAHEDLGSLDEELRAVHPNHQRISELLDRLHTHPDLGTKIGLWLSDPRTQGFLSDINAMGL